MSAAYRVLSPANRDVLEILDCLTKKAGARVALAFDRELRAALQILSVNPGMGHRREDLTGQPVLFFAVSPYLVIYERRRSEIIVHAILHGARDIFNILERRKH